jgi:predicted RNase H-related nuclease YkuK (DUF458 family)
MEKITEGYFYNISCGKLTFQGVVEEISNYILEKPEYFYDIVVGCDSSSGEFPEFPVAIVVLRVGRGGRFFYKKISFGQRKFYSHRERILSEVLLSCDLALRLRESLTKKFSKISQKLKYQFRYIHTDISEKGETKDMIKEVFSIVKSNGFEAKIKPEAFAASCVADRYT